ncbi:hypothetical protein ACP70R_013973 [Stipagrostis hirtigluma subsp. patula]
MPSRKPPPRAADWSDGETSALIGAWGPLYLRRRPRRLVLKEWRAAASAVNAHRAALGRRSNRTRAQCQRRVQNLKARYKEELSKRPPSGWCHFPRLRAFLASPADDPPPCFPANAPAPVKEEASLAASPADGPPPGFSIKAPAPVMEEEKVSGCRLAASWMVPTRPRNGTPGSCAAAVVTKLAEVYRSVELARLDLEKQKMERQKVELGEVKVEK